MSTHALPRPLAFGSGSDDDTGTPQLIDRGDLIAALDRAATRRVTLISAPAGSGKTSLLSAWADRSGRGGKLAVLSVRRCQQDAQQFWLALLSTIRQATGTAGREESPAATPGFNGQAMVERVLSELGEACDGFTLVIDDLHELNCPEALAQLTNLLTNLPPRVHAVLATRRDLRLHLHRLRLMGELAEIRAADLQFTERETRKLLEAARITLSASGVALLHERTEGWAAGVRLAALSLAGHPDPERFVAEFSGSERTVAEYLIVEMLERQPEDVQQLLLRTSLLDQVNGELADVLTGHTGSERILLELEDANAFVVSLDPERTRFRYHHLFADLLRLELRRTSPEIVSVLHRRAAGWLRRQGQTVEAIGHTQAAGDWQEAARLLADHAFSLMLDGQAQTIQALLRAFAPGADYPELALVHAAVDVVHGRFDQAEAVLKAAEDSPLHAYIVLSVLTGARTEELRALHWREVDLDGQPGATPPVPASISVYRSVRAGGDTKTVRSRRRLATPRRCVDALRRHRDRLPYPPEPDALVFATSNGTQLDRHNVLRAFRRVVDGAGLDATAWTPRELRHSFVSLLSASGVRIEDISRLVGHSGTAVTEKVYRHQLHAVLNEGTTAMDALFPLDAETVTQIDTQQRPEIDTAAGS